MKTSTLLFCAAIFSAFGLINKNANAQQTGVWQKSITWIDGSQRLEVFNVPTNYTASKKYKLIVGLHGLQGAPQYYVTFFKNMCGSLQDNSTEVCDSHVYPCTSPVYGNYIIACPQATGTNTNFLSPSADTGLITKIIQDAMSMYNIDPEYIYLNGESLGGRAALCYGLYNWKRFRGIQLWVPAIQNMSEALGGALYMNSSFTYQYQNAKHIPITFMVGTMDGQLYNQTQTYREVYNAGGLTTLQTLYGYCHGPSPDPYTFDALSFIDKNATSFKNNDATIYAVNSPAGVICNGTFTPRVVIQNKGIGTLTSATINYQLDNGTVMTYNWTGSLTQLVRANVILPAQTVTAGAHTLKVYTSMPNGVADAVPANDNMTVNFNYSPSGGLANLSEGFEGQTQKLTGIFQTAWRAPAGWTQTGIDSSFFWELDTLTGGSGGSKVCIHFNNAGIYPGLSAPYNSGKKHSIITPEYDFSASSAPVLTYDYAYAPMTLNSSLLADTLTVKYSSDCGATWTKLLSKGGIALNTSGTSTWGDKAQGAFFGPTSSQWKTETINLNSLVGKPNVIFAFENITGSGNLMYLDNFKLIGATGIADATEENSSIHIYPNPSNGNFIIEGNPAQAQLEIYNSLGEQVAGQKLSDTTTAIDLSGKPNGFYFLKIRTEDGSMMVKKIIKE